MAFLKDRLHENQRYALDLAAEKGASSWLNTLPLKRYHFDLTKTEFRDGLALRFGWEPLKIPAVYPCGDTFSLSHSLQCNKGAYTQMRHDEIRDTLAAVMKEFCFDVEIILVAGFNDHREAVNSFVENWKFLIQLAYSKFNPSQLIIPKTIATSNNSFFNRKINKIILLSITC